MQSLLAGSGTPFLTFLAVALPSFPAVALISSSISPFQQYLSFPAVALISGSGCFPMELRCSAPGQQKLPDGSQPRCRHPLRHSTPGQQLRYGALASNKPHPAEKSTPVWLAIWRTWAGFANSQHRDAAFATPNNICAHSSLLPHWIAAQTLANLSAHLHRLPTPPPYLRRMRLSHGRGRRYRVLDEAVASQGRRRRMANAAAGCSWRSSCKSPRTLPKCKCLITKQLTFIAVRGGINLSSPSTVLKVNYLFISYLCF